MIEVRLTTYLDLTIEAAGRGSVTVLGGLPSLAMDVLSVFVGPKGDKGDAGAPSGQVVEVAGPSASWTIPHALGRAPAVQVQLSSGEVVLAHVTATAEVVNVTFAQPQSGRVILN